MRSFSRRAASGRLSGFPTLLLALAAACGSGVRALPACTTPPAGIGPDATATLQNGDDGTTVCLKAGDVLTVFLRVPLADAASGWGPVGVSGDAVLEARSSGIMTLPRGVRGAIFAVPPGAHGVATLTSERAPCGSGTACGSDRQWRARVVVRS